MQYTAPELVNVNRRKVLGQTLRWGALALGAPLTSALAQAPGPRTADQDLGPFYPVSKPLDQDSDLTVVQGMTGRAQGQVIYLMGRVRNIKGLPVAGARIEIWQANTYGRYTHPADQNSAPLDPNFEGFGVQTTDAEGWYRFKTVKPGDYPVPALGIRRPPHIHFDVTGRNDKLITQMYFPGEALNAKDQLFQRSLGSRDSLLASVQPPAQGMEADALVMMWNITMIRG